VPVEILAHAAADKAGEILFYYGFITDITRHKRAEEELRKSLRLLSSIIEGTDDAVFMKDRMGRYLLFNSAGGRILGKKPGDVLGKDDTFLFTPAEAKAVKEDDRQVMASGRIKTSEDRITDAFGKQRTFLSTKGPIYDEKGEVIGVFGISRDITERKRAEERLRLTQFAVDTCMDSSIWINAEGRIIYVNDVACKNMGYAREELLSMRIWEIDPIFTYEVFQKKWAILKEKGEVKFESVHRRKDGSPFPVEVSSKYLKYENREYEVTFDRDISLRKRDEKEISDAKAQAELYLDLMSHDIQNMNQIGMGFLELAMASTAIAGQDREFLQKTLGSLENSTRLINNVKKMRRAQAGELKLYEVDACAAIMRVLEHYGSASGIRARFTYELPSYCTVIANDLLYEVFENLIGNAIRHGGPAPEIGIRLDTVAVDGVKYYRIAVEDNGPGIPDEVKSWLFRRGETKAKGSGIGLYLVSALVESYHGRVLVEDRIPGDYTQGARFVVLLPAIDN
jgi:PAS domain S-box-containing protein